MKGYIKEPENTDKYWKGLIILLAIFSAISLCQYLPIWEDKPETPVQPAEVKREKAINTDSLKSQIEAQYREKLQAQIKADSARYSKWKANYKPKAQKADNAVIQYQKQPTLENCDSAVTKLVTQVSELETGLAISDSITNRQRNVIASQAGTIVRKDSVIADLNTGWQQANVDNAKLTRKVKNRNKVIKIGAAILAVLAGVIAVR